MVLSKSDLRDPHFLSSEEKLCVSTKNYLSQLTTIPNFRFFLLSFSGSNLTSHFVKKKMPKFVFKTPWHFLYLRETQEKSFERPAKILILRGLLRFGKNI